MIYKHYRLTFSFKQLLTIIIPQEKKQVIETSPEQRIAGLEGLRAQLIVKKQGIESKIQEIEGRIKASEGSAKHNGSSEAS